jgi:hypothetical protein
MDDSGGHCKRGALDKANHPDNSQLDWYPKLFQVLNTFDKDNYF